MSQPQKSADDPPRQQRRSGSRRSLREASATDNLDDMTDVFSLVTNPATPRDQVRLDIYDPGTLFSSLSHLFVTFCCA